MVWGLKYLQTLKDENFLYLYTTPRSLESPLRSGIEGNGVPLHLLNLHYDDRERIYFWHSTYKSLARAEFAGYFEAEICCELQDPNSALARTGRGLAQQIEDTTNLKTYYHLVRYYGRRDGDDKRLCPGCGQKWAVGLTSESGLGRFPFRCDFCRLISDYASDADGDPRSRFGEWRNKT